MKKNIQFGFLIILSTFFIHVNAADFFVANTEEFNAALQKVKAGDCIIWKNGHYTDVKINFLPNNSGIPDKPIILKAETPGNVAFSGSSQICIGGDYLQVQGFLFRGPCTLGSEHVIDFRLKINGKSIQANHCRITDCGIVNYTMSEASGAINYYINLVGTYNEVDHCYFSGKLNKGPTLVVEYQQPKGYVPGSDGAPSTHHHIHHNYFGYRTFSSNGGEQMRIGTSTTSFSHGFNIIEYNYFEEERIEAEIISNKSWNNIYRFNTFVANDGGMVIRHGQQCFVYGNYMKGSSGRTESAGLRIINPNNTCFNNYLENLEGGDKSLKAPITIMSGLVGSELNEYYPADNAIIAYNTVVNSVGPAIRLGMGNSAKGKPIIAPKNVILVGNTIINSTGKNIDPIELSEPNTNYSSKNNFYNNGLTNTSGFSLFNTKEIIQKNGFKYLQKSIDQSVIDSINQRLSIHHIQLSVAEITQFNPQWIITKQQVGVSWMKMN